VSEKGTLVRWGLEEDEAQIAELMELNGMRRALAFEERFIVAEGDGKVLAALRYRTEPKRLLLGLRFEGREGAREHYAMWWSAFGNTLDGGELHWVEDDLAIGDATFVGCHVGPFAGLPPTGRPMRLPFVVFVRFRDGLLAGERIVYDLNGLLRQLGQPAFEPSTT
jgi:hypothetical protein